MLPGLTGFLVDERTGVRTGRCGVLVGAYRARASGRVIRRSQMVPARLGRHRVRLRLGDAHRYGIEEVTDAPSEQGEIRDRIRTFRVVEGQGELPELAFHAG